MAEKLLGKPLTIPPTVLQSPAMKGKRNFQYSQPVQKGGKPGKADKVPAKGAVKTAAKPEAAPVKGLPPKNVKDAKAMHEHYKLDGTFTGDPKFKYHDDFQATAKVGKKTEVED